MVVGMGLFNNLIPNCDIYLDDIIRKLKAKEMAFFVGAGLSLGSGLPSWEELIKFLCQKYSIRFDDKFHGDPNDVNKGQYLQDIAEQVEKKVGSSRDIVKSINECFEEKKPDCGYSIDMQQLLVTIAARTSGVIFTTNYDDLLERAAESVGIKKTVFAFPELFKSADLKNVLKSNHIKRDDGSLCIFKIHGTAVNGERVVLSNSSYENAYRKQLISLITELSRINILFLGCSFTDSYFGTQYREENMGDGKWYAFYPTLSAEKVKNSNLLSQNINVVGYIINDMFNNNQHNKNIKYLFEYFIDELNLSTPFNITSRMDIITVKNNQTIKKIRLVEGLERDWCLEGLSAVEEVVCCKEITRIPNRAFFNCKSLKKICFEAQLVAIGDQAFDGCVQLERIQCGDNVNVFRSLERLGEKAFRNCDELKSLDFGDECNIDFVPRECFQGCNSLAQVSFPKKIKKICENAFRDCVSLLHFNFQNYAELVEIGLNAFQHCCKLAEAYIMDAVSIIGGGAFQECVQLLSVRIPNNLKKVESYCFAECCSLESLTNLEYSSVSLIELHAFQNCRKLRRIAFPKSCNLIAAEAFMGCYSLDKIELSTKIEIHPSAFVGCSDGLIEMIKMQSL